MPTQKELVKEWLYHDASTDSITAAAAVSISQAMRRIENLLLQLGADGIHELIRREVKTARRRDRARQARITAKRKAARLSNLAAEQTA